jgi:ribonuclease D
MSITFVSSRSGLNTAIERLESAQQIAVDLEFDRNFYRYGFNLCLVQIYDGENCYLIDPLSNGLEIDELFPVLEHPGREKVVFAFGEDLRLLHSLGCFPKNIFDLDIATSLLGYPPSSLNTLLEEVLGVDTGKSSQKSNWFRRPLTSQQIGYAAQDVLHLFRLRDLLTEQAEEKQITSWIAEENSDWDQLDFSEMDNTESLKEKDKKDLNEVEWHIFKALISYRDELAKKSNKPAFQIFGKNVIYSIIREPSYLDNWTNAKGVFNRIKTAGTREKLCSIVREAEEEAAKNGLSSGSPARKAPDAEMLRRYRTEKQKVDRYRNKLFDPVKEEIKKEYGEQAASFIFSNRMIADLVTGRNGQMKEYKKELIIRYADDLKLDRDLVKEFTGS